MLEKKIKFTTYDGDTITQSFYFNMNKSELIKMQLSVDGGFQSYLRRILEAHSTPELTKNFDELILASYGEKSPDGKRFVKIAPDGHRLADDFMQSAAYDVLFMELMTDEKAAADFINGIIPSDLAEKASEMAKNDPELANLALVSDNQ